MNEELQQKLAELADKLGVSVEHLWGVLVTQAPISCAIHMGALVLGITTAIWAGWLVFNKARRYEPKDIMDDGQIPLYIVSAFFYAATIVMLTYLATSLPLFLSGFINPEYWAMKEIGDLL